MCQSDSPPLKKNIFSKIHFFLKRFIFWTYIRTDFFLASPQHLYYIRRPLYLHNSCPRLLCMWVWVCVCVCKRFPTERTLQLILTKKKRFGWCRKSFQIWRWHVHTFKSDWAEPACQNLNGLLPHPAWPPVWEENQGRTSSLLLGSLKETHSETPSRRIQEENAGGGPPSAASSNKRSWRIWPRAERSACIASTEPNELKH